MKPANDMRPLFHKAAVHTNPHMDETVLEVVLAAHEKATSEDSTVTRSGIRSVCMRNPVTRLAVAAAVLAVIGLGIFEFIGTGSKSGVVWAEVAQKVDASRGTIYRMREIISDETDQVDYAMAYSSPTRERADYYKAGQIVRSIYADYEAKTVVYISPEDKRYIRDTHSLSQSRVQEHQNWIDPKGLVSKFLSCEHKTLEPKMIEGTLCEGLATTDLAFFGSDFPVPISRLDVQLWVSIRTGYPVLFKGEILCGKDGSRRIEGVADQFQWDVELDPNELEPKIPEGYTLEEWPS